jgi:hypothetical protein
MTRLCVVVAAVLLSGTAFAEGEDEEGAKPAAADDEDPTPKAKGKAKAPADDEEAPAKKGAAASVEASTGDLIPEGSPKGRMTLPGGKIMFNVVAEANMAKSLVAKPIGIAPDLWLGLHDKLTLGAYHSGRAATGFLTGFGSGICLRGKSGMGNGMGGGMPQDACATGLGKVYTFAGAEARIGLLEGGLAVAFVLGAQARTFKPDKLFAGKAGLLARINSKRLAIEISPSATVGLNKRKLAGMDYNAAFDGMAIPVTIYLRFAPRFSLAVQSGATFLFKKPGDTYKIPAAAGLSFWASPHFSIDAAFGLGAVKDKDPDTKATDARSATVGIGYAL